LKIWFDVLTPKQLLFFEPMIKRIKKNNTVLCTSRDYDQVTQLAKIRNLKLVIVGKHGGSKRHDKLNASLRRAKLLSTRIKKFSPDITISFCSPEAARVSYGLGIPHICFSDSPHAENVMRLVVPLVQKLLIPWIIPKKKFTKFGIDQNNIIQYKAIDAATISKRKIKNIKIAYGGMASIPKRAKYCEKILLNSSITEQIINKAKEALEKDFKPISDMRASRKYRMEVAKNLLRKCFLEITQKKLIRVMN